LLLPSCLILLAPPSFPLFPYTTLFRSLITYPFFKYCQTPRPPELCIVYVYYNNIIVIMSMLLFCYLNHDTNVALYCYASSKDIRSEEHTSALQSRETLVCRLLLEKKNN